MSTKIAIIEPKPSRTNLSKSFNDAFEFDRYSLCSDNTVKRILKKDVDIDINIDEYNWVILIGADTCKHFLKGINVTDHSGKVVEDKFIPVINPGMVSFKPEMKLTWEESRDNIIGYVTGEKKVVSYSTDRIYGIQDTEQAIKFLKAAIASKNDFCAMDSETSALYPRDGYVLGISISYERDHGAYIDSNYIDDECTELLQELLDKKTIVLHNAKFDIPFIEFHFNVKFKKYEDTMLLHYCIDENPGTHGLKQLAIKYTPYGDYERPMHDWIDQYRKEHGILKDNFSFEFIPFDIIKTYAAIDAIVTFLIYIRLKPAVNKNKQLNKVYNEILIPASTFLIDVQDNGVPFDLQRLHLAQNEIQKQIDEDIKSLYKDPRIKEFETEQGKEFNPNSVVQLRSLLFDKLGIKPSGRRTSTGKHSTDAETLQELALEHDIPKLILNIRKNSKIKNTYLDKIIPQLNVDGRLRTNFNIHGTTSGRLSSSGKLNMQQLPRDNPAVKGAIKANPGFKIVSMDLTTAEVYVVSVLSGDKKLQNIFKSGGDFHSTIAKRVFHLKEDVSEIKEKQPLWRQAAKSTTFGILYQAGPDTVMQQVNKEAKDRGLNVNFTFSEAIEAIDAYFAEFRVLKKWIDTNKDFIQSKGYIYSHFGRKRRLANVLSSDNAVRSHAIRSGINFLVQSPASDINLLAGIEMNNYMQRVGMKSKIFALVHDSILAEVHEDELEEYQNKLREFVQTDRGLSIPEFPIGCDFEIDNDYSFGKFEKLYGVV